jgi:uncharacterized protein involved in exopolysaccharide biosynthesis
MPGSTARSHPVLRQIESILRRRLLLILAIGVTIMAILGTRLTPTYSSSVRLQITTPPSEWVAVFEQTEPYHNLRDDLTVARNNFVEVARSPEVRVRTLQTLGLATDGPRYGVELRQIRDSDFIELNVDAPTLQLAEQIANAHAAMSVQNMAELRAMPARAAKQLIVDQLAARREKLDAAEREAAEMSSSATTQNLQQARTDYSAWQAKLREAEVKSSSDYAASFIQIVGPATVPSQRSSQFWAQLALAGLGALTVGGLAAIGLELTPRPLLLRRREARLTNETLLP